jgi:serine protease Do
MDQQDFQPTSSEPETQNNKRPSAETKSNSFAKLLVIILIMAVVGGFSAGAGAMFFKNYIMPDETQTPVLTTQPATEGAIAASAGKRGYRGHCRGGRPKRHQYYKHGNVHGFLQHRAHGSIFGLRRHLAVTADSVDILTNEHVVADAKEVMVQLKPDQYFKAEIIGKDKSTDLAIIRIPAADIPAEVFSTVKAAKFGDSDNLKVGEVAIAIGNPLGYNSTVTVGVISAVDREIKDKNSLKLIQTDAAINPGNSGGALVNSRGEVIGINTIKIANTEVEGIGFAIPSNSAVPIVNELASKGFVSRPYLGIYGMEINAETAEAYDIPVGIYVRGVIESSGAESAGIAAEDVIISVDDTRIETMTQLSELLAQHKVGDKVTVRVVRGGSTLELEVTLTDANS